jgi:hypothetical protein
MATTTWRSRSDARAGISRRSGSIALCAASAGRANIRRSAAVPAALVATMSTDAVRGVGTCLHVRAGIVPAGAGVAACVRERQHRPRSRRPTLPEVGKGAISYQGSARPFVVGASGVDHHARMRLSLLPPSVAISRSVAWCLVAEGAPVAGPGAWRGGGGGCRDASVTRASVFCAVVDSGRRSAPPMSVGLAFGSGADSSIWRSFDGDASASTQRLHLDNAGPARPPICSCPSSGWSGSAHRGGRSDGPQGLSG